MYIILAVILPALTATWIADISRWFDYLKLWIYNDTSRRLKPLDCAMCLSFWLSIVFQLLSGCFIPELFIFVSISASTTSLIISKWLKI